MSKSPSWSFSSYKDFQTCPKQYYHKRVLKEIPFEETEATRYGNLFHKAAEEFIRDGKPLPKEFKYALAALEKLRDMPGEKHCELKFALDENLEPCDFKSKNAWWRGIADLLIINGNRAKVLDYKTGASAKYADKGQLELMALAVFKYFPEVEFVDGGLLFVIARAFPKAKYPKEQEAALWHKWLNSYGIMKAAHESGVFNPKPSGLCKKHCPVLSCQHNGLN